MPKLTLVSHHLCPYVQRAAIALAEKEVLFERIYIDLANKPDWFKVVSPLSKVPVLIVSDKARADVIFESAAIVEYLDDTQGVPLHPEDPLERAKHRAWIEVCSNLLNAIARLYNAKDEESFIEAHSAIGILLSRIERELEIRTRGPFFTGETFSLVDTVFGPAFRYFDIFESEVGLWFFGDQPRTSAWRAALASRESVKKAVPDDYSARLITFLQARPGVLSARIAA